MGQRRTLEITTAAARAASPLSLGSIDEDELLQMLAFRLGASARQIAALAQRLPGLQPRADAAHVISELTAAEQRILTFARQRARAAGISRAPGARERPRAA